MLRFFKAFVFFGLSYLTLTSPATFAESSLPVSIRQGLVFTWREAVAQELDRVAKKYNMNSDQLDQFLKDESLRMSQDARTARIKELEITLTVLHQRKDTMNPPLAEMSSKARSQRVRKLDSEIDALKSTIQELQSNMDDAVGEGLDIPLPTDEAFARLQQIVEQNSDDQEARKIALKDAFGKNGVKMGIWMRRHLKKEKKLSELKEKTETRDRLALPLQISQMTSELTQLKEDDSRVTQLSSDPNRDQFRQAHLEIVAMTKALNERLQQEKIRIQKVYDQTPTINSERALKKRLKILADEVRGQLVEREAARKKGADTSAIDKAIAGNIELYLIQVEKTNVSVGDWIRKPLMILFAGGLLTTAGVGTAYVLNPDLVERVVSTIPGILTLGYEAAKKVSLSIYGYAGSFAVLMFWFGGGIIETVNEYRPLQKIRSFLMKGFGYDPLEDPFDRSMREFDREMDATFDPVGYYTDEFEDVRGRLGFFASIRKSLARSKIRRNFEKRATKGAALAGIAYGISPNTVILNAYTEHCKNAVSALTGIPKD